MKHVSEPCFPMPQRSLPIFTSSGTTSTALDEDHGSSEAMNNETLGTFPSRLGRSQPAFLDQEIKDTSSLVERLPRRASR